MGGQYSRAAKSNCYPEVSAEVKERGKIMETLGE